VKTVTLGAPSATTTVLGIIAITVFILCGAGVVSADTGEVAPSQAAAVGYVIKTYSGLFSKETVDLDNTGRPNFDWYPWHFFGQKPPARESALIKAEGNIVLGTDSLDSSFASAAPAHTASRWVGVAFGGGGYFEATLKFDPEKTAKGKPRTWPAFWSLAIEHAASLQGEQWPGQPSGYMHFIEPDFFEYDVWGFSPRHYYGGAIHDWYGIYKKTCPGKGFCGVSNATGDGTNFSNFKVKTPAETDYTKFHKFGFLWVPAKPASQGYAQYYFDGRATEDRITWEQYTNQAPPPGRAPWTFGVIDRQHLVLIIGTGVDQPMTVASLSVWQSSSENNLKQ